MDLAVGALGAAVIVWLDHTTADRGGGGDPSLIDL